jgi:ferredoxin
MTEQADGRWRVRVDPVACCGSGMCATVAPGVFAAGPDGKAVVLVAETTDEHAVDAAELCPGGAIEVDGAADVTS